MREAEPQKTEGVGQKARPDSPLPPTGPLPLAVDFGFPIQREDDAKAEPKYKGLFLKMLMVVAEHFEQITYADQHEGRIEARTVDATRTGIIREASVSFQASADGCLSITALVNKVKVTGDKSKVIGRDTDLEQVILNWTKPKQLQGRRFRGAGEEMTTPSSHPGTTLPASLKGAWRVVSAKGGDRAYDTFRQTDLIFVGERLVAAPSGSDDFSPASVYQVHLGARRPVQEIDLTQKGDAGGTRLLGIYDVKGDELLLCLSAQQGTRPSTFDAGPKQALLVTRRVKE
jgi:uncharacterized protein (TIGR03067 family)